MKRNTTPPQLRMNIRVTSLSMVARKRITKLLMRPNTTLHINKTSHHLRLNSTMMRILLDMNISLKSFLLLRRHLILTLAFNNSKSRRTKSSDRSATFTKRSPLRSIQLELEAILMFLATVLATPMSLKKKAIHHPMINQSRLRKRKPNLNLLALLAHQP